MRKHYISLFFTVMLLFVSCVPTGMLVTTNDIGNGKAFIINLMHMNGSNKTKTILGSLFSGNKYSYNVDVVNLFKDSKGISKLYAAGTGGANMGELFKTYSGQCNIEIDAYKGKQNKLFGYATIKINLKPDQLYAIVTEVDKSEDNAFVDVYKLGTNDLLEIIKNSQDLSKYELADKYYNKITSGEKLFSNLQLKKNK